MVSFSGSNEIDILSLNNKFASTHQTSVWVDTTSKTIIINITHERKDLQVEVNQMFFFSPPSGRGLEDAWTVRAVSGEDLEIDTTQSYTEVEDWKSQDDQLDNNRST